MQKAIIILAAMILTSSFLSGCTVETQVGDVSTGVSSEVSTPASSELSAAFESESSFQETIVETTNSEQRTEGRIFPDGDTDLIRWIDLYPLSLTDLAFARNDFFC